jgi:Ca-activated chloride channel family protein
MRKTKMKAWPTRTLWLLTLVACALAAAAPAQEKKEGKKDSAADALRVSLHVSVFDAQNQPVTNLNAEDFEVLEDGVAQKLTHFERREGPLAFGLVVDNSGSFHDIIDGVIGLGRSFVNESGPGAVSFVVRFVSTDEIKVMHGVTTDKRALVDALDAMYIEGGQTAVGDAVYLSAEHLASYKAAMHVPHRYGLVLITDGEDRASYYKPEQVHRKLREAGVPVYALGIVKGSRLRSSPEKARRYLERLAFESGGTVYFAEHPRDLAPAVRHILDEMGAPYALAYAPANQKRDGRPRRLEVRAKGPAGPLTVKAKTEYTATDKK